MGRLSGDALAAFVARSCERSGVPLKVSDPGSVRDVAVLLSGRAEPDGASRPVGRTVSDSPGDLDAVRVEAATLDDSGCDGDVVDDGLHDGGLSSEVEGGPLSA